MRWTELGGWGAVSLMLIPDVTFPRHELQSQHLSGLPSEEVYRPEATYQR